MRKTQSKGDTDSVVFTQEAIMLYYAPEDGSLEGEYVVFTEDEKPDIEGWRKPGFTLQSQTKVEIPTAFPYEVALVKEM